MNEIADRGTSFDGVKIGRPATAALLDAGFESLTELPVDLRELRSIHAVGPSALRRLEAARAQRRDQLDAGRPDASFDTGDMSAARDCRPPFDAVLEVLSRADPEGLLAIGAPSDEYANEAADLATRLRDGRPVTSEVLVDVWEHWFGPGSGYVRRASEPEIARLADELDAIRR